MPAGDQERHDDVEQLRASGFLTVTGKYGTQDNAADDQQR